MDEPVSVERFLGKCETDDEAEDQLSRECGITGLEIIAKAI